ncbi:MAG: xanthine dehydrogenase family protein molybdopterin-binding subunit, partial [Anaerolineae bacterium]
PRDRASSGSRGVKTGQSVPYIDGRERVTGHIEYVLNLEVPGMLHGKVLRSPYPHARVLGVDTSEAERLPGVVAVLKGSDILDHPDVRARFGPVYRDQGVVAINKVRFVGDPVVAVAAVDEDVAEEALDLIQVDYEELAAVFDLEEAIRPDAPLVHETIMRREESFADIILRAQDGTNICNHFQLRKGDVDIGFAEADLIFEDTFSTPAYQHVNLEPHVCIAQVDGAKNVTVWSSTQTPYIVRAQLAETFRVPQSQVRVIVPTLGGGYGAKTYPKIEPLTAMLAWKAGRPVKITLTRAEDFVSITKHASKITMKTGVKRDGTIVAREVRAYWNAGAYADISPRLIKNGGYASPGPYRIPHVKVDSYAVYTNLPPAGAFRGYGVGQVAWAYESQMDMIAERLGMDSVEFRMKNFIGEGDTYATGEVVHDPMFARLTHESAKWIGWDQPSESVDGTRRRGKGVACIIKGTITPSTSKALARINPDGSCTVLTSTVEMGQGSRTILAQIVSDAFDLPIEQIKIVDPDTDITPYDLTTSSSRSTFSMGTAVMMAAEDAKQQLRETASELLEASADDLEIVGGRVQVKGSPESGLSFAEVISQARLGEVDGRGTFTTEGGIDPETGQGIASVHWHQASAAVEVEVDIGTGKVDVLRLQTSLYTGRTVNPVNAELQTEGNLFFGQGKALLEEMVFDHGQLVNGTLADYMLPSFLDAPDDLGVALIEHDDPNAEVHGIGETALPPVAPAIGNAVYNAVGIRIQDLPITPEKVLKALRLGSGDVLSLSKGQALREKAQAERLVG